MTLQENINKFMEIINSKNYDYIHVSIYNMEFRSSIILNDLDVSLDVDKLEIKSNSKFNLSIKLNEIKEQLYKSYIHNSCDAKFEHKFLNFEMNSSCWISLLVCIRIE